MGLEIGSRIAHYRLERRLGAGGMGEVYLARDEKLDRLVAIKLLSARSDDQSRRRLLKEARSVAGLDHPGICAVYEVSQDPECGDFIAMQYIEGDTLAARLRRGRLKPDEALALGSHIAEALIAAHRHGIVHRDLKPHNIIVTPSGAPKLLDFGLATHVASSSAAANAVTTSQLSDPNTVMGTPGFMAPEQVRNEPADFRTDVFAFGCVLYECLTGRRAFTGATNAETLGQILHVDPPPVSKVVPELGPAYDALCARLLAKDPDERFQSAEEVLGAIRALTPTLRSSTAVVPIAPPRRMVSLRWVITGVAIAIAVYFGARIFRGGALPKPTPEAVVWYDRGVEAMRDGTYAGARTAFQEAIAIFPQYAQAHARLAEAYAALDDEGGAKEASLQAQLLVPNRSRLDPDDRLRFEAASESALRHFAAAVNAYQELAQRKTDDAGRLLDLGRAQEAAGGELVAKARENYAKAVQLSAQYAPAHLRLGVLQARARLTEGLASIDHAIELYEKASKTEGEAEAVLRKGIALSSLSKFADARQSLGRVLQIAAAEQKCAAQGIAARIELAKLEIFAGKFASAEEFARQAAADAQQASLPTLAASALIYLGNALNSERKYGEADAELAKATDLAINRSRRTENRAKLTRASVNVQMAKYDDALKIVATPLEYFKETGETGLAVQARLIASRAHTELDQDDLASRLTDEALELSKSDEGLTATALENLARQLEKSGDLPGALTTRERIDGIHRSLKDRLSLPFDLANHAELLVVLGRADDAKSLIDELEQGIKTDPQAYGGQKDRLTRLNVMMATLDRRFRDAVRLAGEDPSDLKTRVLAEYARAHMGQSRRAVADIVKWPSEADRLADQRELAYWVAQILLARGDRTGAETAASAPLSVAAVEKNAELGWRLAAVRGLASRLTTGTSNSASISALIKTKTGQIETAWGNAAAKVYFSRPDLLALRKAVE